jgi:integrase
MTSPGTSARDHRLGAAVALLFLQGWRVSEVLGLAWEDVDLDAGTALVRRASVYVDGRGQQLGPPKTEGARGEHWLMPTVVALLRQRQAVQDTERATSPTWATITYGGQQISLVFTNPTGGLVLRQAVAKVVKQAAKTAGISADLGTHTGRRTVVTLCSWTATRRWRTSPASSVTPGRPRPPATSSGSAAGPRPSLNGPQPSSTAT